eukprot:3193650-Rhodomonas_salina.2
MMTRTSKAGDDDDACRRSMSTAMIARLTAMLAGAEEEEEGILQRRRQQQQQQQRVFVRGGGGGGGGARSRPGLRLFSTVCTRNAGVLDLISRRVSVALALSGTDRAYGAVRTTRCCCLRRRCATLPAYALAMRCPVLTQPTCLLCDVRYGPRQYCCLGPSAELCYPPPRLLCVVRS